MNEFMELTITYNFNCVNTWNTSLVIKINTPIIEIHNIACNSSFCISYTNNLCKLPILNNDVVKFNANFKIVKCHTLTIIDIDNRDFNYNNLPLSLTKLIIKGNTQTIYLKNMELPNLETIQLEGSNIQNIHSSISHLKTVKTIRITGCSAFQERDLLLTNGYKFESY